MNHVKINLNDINRTLFLGLLIIAAGILAACGMFDREPVELKHVGTIVLEPGKIGEPFGIAIKDNEVFVSDGEKGIIWKIGTDGKLNQFAKGLSTPSHIAFDDDGILYVADSGDHTIRKVDTDGTVTIAAGVSGKRGDRDGPATSALFNAPIGVAVIDGKVFVADTYNDKIRVISDGSVKTIAGSAQGFNDASAGGSVKFDTPTGIAAFGDSILVADTGNRRLRVVKPEGETHTFAGGTNGNTDGMLGSAGFQMPIGVMISNEGTVFVTDGDSVRSIEAAFIPVVRKLSGGARGFGDGLLNSARFNRPGGIAVRENGDVLIADSDNGLIRVLTGTESTNTLSAKDFRRSRPNAEKFRMLGKPRWPFNPPDNTREIAGTLGEIRGKITKSGRPPHFHNGLDIAGGYGEEVYTVRAGKVLRPLAVAEFGNSREHIRLPDIGYIHLRLGRDAEQNRFGDSRFQFREGPGKKPSGLRVPRGSVFKPGEKLGTLNAMNHIHLIAGPAGGEFNALDALSLPGVSDSRVPVIEDVKIFDSDWKAFETENGDLFIKNGSRIRITAKAYDQMDGNPDRRRLGVYKTGYQLLDEGGNPLEGKKETEWTIAFDVTPSESSVALVYAEGSVSGATGQTIFDYIVSNRVNSREANESTVLINPGSGKNMIIRVFVADYFGNTEFRDVSVLVE